jgi:hypothetical protein
VHGWNAPHAQAPPTHVPTPHAFPHAPQFAPLVCRSTHALPQTTSPAGHSHAPATHDAPPGQTRPHAPQLAGSLAYDAGSTHTPRQDS